MPKPEYRAEKSSLEGCVLKMNRAQEHFDALHEAIEGFAESDYYTLVSDQDRQGRPIMRAKNVRKPPKRISVLIGEFVYLSARPSTTSRSS